MSSIDPFQHPLTFAAAFNSGDVGEVERLYEPAALLVPTPSSPVTGTERAAANQRVLDLGLPVTVQPRHVYVAGDIALLIVDWSIEGAGITATATDVVRRGPDGRWRYVIDNPYGTSPAGELVQ